MEEGEGLAANVEVATDRSAETRREHLAEAVRIVFGRVAPGHRLDDVTRDREIERRVVERQRERVAVLKLHTRCERAAAGVDHGAVQRVAVEDRLLLRPDRLRLRREVADHRLIGHFFRLRAARVHGRILSR
ncbi:MAG TPA: hypothetical protein VLU46_07530 [Thermoanaerobaculia bacterium]|nr:hypothetical protein [Thermoanaerobaculia bacterium]